jgi:hypothetical protein
MKHIDPNVTSEEELIAKVKNNSADLLALTLKDISGMTDEQYKELLVALRGNTKIQRLDCSNSKLNEKNVKRIVEILGNNKSIQELDLSNAASPPVSLSLESSYKRTIIASIKNNKTLRVLKLNNNSDQEINWFKFVYSELRDNKFLENIELSNCGFGFNAMPYLNAILSNNVSIKDFNLANNNLSTCVPALLDMLKPDFAIVKIDLSNNRIYTQQKQRIIEALQKHRKVAVDLVFGESQCPKKMLTLLTKMDIDLIKQQILKNKESIIADRQMRYLKIVIPKIIAFIDTFTQHTFTQQKYIKRVANFFVVDVGKKNIPSPQCEQVLRNISLALDQLAILNNSQNIDMKNIEAILSESPVKPSLQNHEQKQDFDKDKKIFLRDFEVKMLNVVYKIIEDLICSVVKIKDFSLLSSSLKDLEHTANNRIIESSKEIKNIIEPPSMKGETIEMKDI